MVYLYNNNGEYQGCTQTPEDFPELNHTVISPPEYDEFDETVVFVNGTWEIRNAS